MILPGVVYAPVSETKDAAGNLIVPPELDPTTAFGKRSDDTYGSPTAGMGSKPSSGNRGLYGVDLEYKFQIKNTDPVSSHACYVTFLGRDNNGMTFGAANIVLPSGYPNGTVQSVNYYATTTCELTPGLPGLPDPIKLEKGSTGPVDVVVRFAHAGSSALPVNIALLKPTFVPPWSC